MIQIALLLLALPPYPDPLAAGWEGMRVCEVMEENASLRVLKCTFPPGVGHELHRHAPHWGYVLSGGLQRVRDDADVRELDVPTGYSWWSNGTLHEVVNVGDTTTEYLIVEPKGPKDE